MEKSLIENLFFDIRRIFRKGHIIERCCCQNFGDLRLLRIITHHFNNKATPSQLAKHLEVSLPTISQKLTNLEDAGYIERKMSSKDRRKTYICLTNKGEELLSEGYRKFMDKVGNAAEKLGDEKCNELVNLLDELLEHLDDEIEKKEGGCD